MKLKTQLLGSFIFVATLILVLIGSGLYFSMEAINEVVDTTEEIVSVGEFEDSYKTEIDSQTENKLMVTRGERGERNKLRDWD